MVNIQIERKNLLGMPKKDKISFFDVLLIILITLLFLNVFVQSFWLSPVEVSGTSMEKTLQHEDWLLIDKFAKPQRGEVVVFKATKYDNYIKRIIATGGDQLYSKKGVIFLKVKGSDDFVELNEDYAYFDSIYGFGTYLDKSYRDIPLTTIEEGKMFVLGDNRWGSKDSRQIGQVDESTIIGIVPKWAIENRHSYAWYYDFIERVNVWIRKTFKGSK